MLPSTRCVSHASLVPLIQQTQERLHAPTFRKHSAINIIRILESAELLRPLPLDPPEAGGKAVRLYVLGFNGSWQPSALEALQAYRPAGVLCYFSALELHGLTTQPTPHYHLALFRPDPNPSSSEAKFDSSGRPPPLGIAAFSMDGVCCLLTGRDPKNLQGIQRRRLNPQCIVRVTTLEQTLLDCLHRPGSVGGAAAVFEAWETGVPKVKVDQLWMLLDAIGDTNLIRRTGYMLEHHQGDPALINRIRSVLALRRSDGPPASLLPSIPYTNTANDWHLKTP